jgi:hypothetical protein
MDSNLSPLVLQIPPKEELTNVLDKIKGFFSNATGSVSGTSSS